MMVLNAHFNGGLKKRICYPEFSSDGREAKGLGRLSRGS